MVEKEVFLLFMTNVTKSGEAPAAETILCGTETDTLSETVKVINHSGSSKEETPSRGSTDNMHVGDSNAYEVDKDLKNVEKLFDSEELKIKMREVRDKMSTFLRKEGIQSPQSNSPA